MILKKGIIENCFENIYAGERFKQCELRYTELNIMLCNNLITKANICLT